MKQLLATLFTITGLAATLCAQPAYLNYQGRLSDAAGAPLDNGTYTLEFNIYDTANGANKVWGPFLFDGNTSPGHAPLVVVLQGRFNVILGPADTATPTARPLQDAFGGTNRFVEIKVDGGAPIVPRQQLLSSPYAFRAFRAYDADRATVATTVSDVNVAYRNTANTFTGNQTVNGSVTATVNVTAGGNIAATGNVTAGGRGVAVGEENLRIVRGEVAGQAINGACVVSVGGGFVSATRTAVGEYTVTFNSPFNGIPTVTASAFLNGPAADRDLFVSIAARNASSVQVRIFADGPDSGEYPRDSAFTFIAIGPR